MKKIKQAIPAERGGNFRVIRRLNIRKSQQEVKRKFFFIVKNEVSKIYLEENILI